MYFQLVARCKLRFIQPIKLKYDKVRGAQFVPLSLYKSTSQGAISWDVIIFVHQFGQRLGMIRDATEVYFRKFDRPIHVE